MVVVGILMRSVRTVFCIDVVVVVRIVFCVTPIVVDIIFTITIVVVDIVDIVFGINVVVGIFDLACVVSASTVNVFLVIISVMLSSV